MPPSLLIDNTPHTVKLVRVDIRGRELQTARVFAGRLPSGDILLIGHDASDVRQIGQVVPVPSGSACFRLFVWRC